MNYQEINDYEDFYFDFLQYQYSFYRQALQHRERIVYKDMGIFPELIFAAGLIPIMLEVMVSMIQSDKLKNSILEESNQYFFENDVCSFNKVAIPALSENLIPFPCAFVNTTVCQDAKNNFELLSYKFRIPHFVLDYPYLNALEVKEYLKKQYIKIFSELCSLNNTKVNIDKLKQCIIYANQAVEYIEKGNNLRKAKQPLIYGGQMLKFTNIFSFFGTKESVEIVKKYYEICRNKQEQNNVIENCKYRLLWCNTAPIYDDNLFFYIEKNLGAIIISEELNYVNANYLDENDPFGSLAERAIRTSVGGELNKRITNILNCIDDYQIDGVIFFEQQNCRLFNINYQLIKEAVQKKGVKILKLSGDCFDKQNYSKELLLTRIEAFIEIL